MLVTSGNTSICDRTIFLDMLKYGYVRYYRTEASGFYFERQTAGVAAVPRVSCRIALTFCFDVRIFPSVGTFFFRAGVLFLAFLSWLFDLWA